MIIISCSLPKSGSTIFATYIEEMLSASDTRNGQNHLKEKLGGRYFDRIDPKLMIRMLLINCMHGTVVIKSHCSPHRIVRWLILAKLAKAVYIYRDPRDVVLSAMDHRKNRGGHAFSDFTSLETGSERVKGWAKVWREWAAFGFVHFVRYEDLMADPKAALANVCKYFKLEISNEKIQSIIDKHEKDKSRSLNYNKGTVGRFSGELDIQEQKRLTRKLDRLVIEMGYK